MTIPPNTTVFDAQADPRDYTDWKIGAGLLLEVDEQIEAFDMVLGAEAVAAGLIIAEDAPRAPAIVDGGKGILLWLSVEPGMRLDPIFDGVGVTLSIEVTIDTNSIPLRTFQRTVAVKVAQQ